MVFTEALVESCAKRKVYRLQLTRKMLGTPLGLDPILLRNFSMRNSTKEAARKQTTTDLEQSASRALEETGGMEANMEET